MLRLLAAHIGPQHMLWAFDRALRMTAVCSRTWGLSLGFGAAPSPVVRQRQGCCARSIVPDHMISRVVDRRRHSIDIRARLARAAAVDFTASADVPAPAVPRLGADIPLRLEEYNCDGVPLHLLLPDAAAVTRMYAAAGLEDRDSHWCHLWPSALALATELLQRPALLAGRRCYELGCGLGLAGLAAALAGASEVLLLDREPLALQCALLNASLNGLRIVDAPDAAEPGAGAAGSSSGSSGDAEGYNCTCPISGTGIRVADVPSPQEILPHLEPQDAARLQAGLSQREHSAGRCQLAGCVAAATFDWSRPEPLEPPDILLVADCLYAPSAVQAVAGAAPQLLSQAGGQLILADPLYRARSNRERFLRMLCKGSGFAVAAADERWALHTAGSGGRGASNGGGWSHDGGGSPQRVPIALLHLQRISCL
ncbi:hypothetical protein ABPG77_002014 [Micractinium sp. CCAP 211/92]